MQLSKLRFGAFLTYVPRKEDDKSFIQAVKQDKVLPDLKITTSEFIAREVKEKLGNAPQFSEFFGKDVYLVPVVKSSLMKTKDTLWVSKRIAEELDKLGLGKVFDCLERIKPVSQSHLLKSENRLKPLDHYNTIIVKKTLEEPKKLLLIDDVITRGSTLLGCANRLKETFPYADIKAFVAVQTISNSKNFKKREDPYIGEITLMHDGNSSTNR